MLLKWRRLDLLISVLNEVLSQRTQEYDGLAGGDEQATVPSMKSWAKELRNLLRAEIIRINRDPQ